MNIHLMCKKSIYEATQVFKKYPNLDFYLKDIAFGRKYEFVAYEMVKKAT